MYIKRFITLFLAIFCTFASNSFAQNSKPAKGASVPPAVIPHQFTGRVVGVLDGDTIRVANAEISVVTVRLEGIDAPESAQEFGQEAKTYLHDLISNKQVTVQWKERDKYQRLLGYVFHENELVNRSLVENGFAWQFTKYNSSPALKAIEQSARDQKIGLWKNPKPIPPWDWRDGVRPPKEPPPSSTIEPAYSYQMPEKSASEPASTAKRSDPIVYLTKTGTHYHSAGCRHLSKSAIPIPLSRAGGYTPCQHCNPPR